MHNLFGPERPFLWFVLVIVWLVLATILVSGCAQQRTATIVSMPPGATRHDVDIAHAQCNAESLVVIPGVPVANNPYPPKRFDMSGFGAAYAAQPRIYHDEGLYIGCMAQHGILVRFD